MARLTVERKAHLEAILPPLADTQARVRSYMTRADMSQKQFGELIGYSVPAITALLKGSYNQIASSDLGIRYAAEDAMQRHPVGLASNTPAGRLYETENVVQMRRWFEHCHKHRALAFVYGPPGSQKTFVATHLVQEFNRRELSQEPDGACRNRAFYVRASINIHPRDMIAKICVEVGAPTGYSLQRCMSGLRQQLRNTRTVLLLDEMQLCGIPALEALRELNEDGRGIGMLLMGSHGLKKFFDERAAELEQWNSRLDAGIELSGVSDACARAIVELENPDLDADQVNALIEDSRVQDIYSRDRNRKYLSMRRLFKTLAALRQLSTEAQEATQ
jgi:DNA transposition AAA+ family ATPase